MKSINMSEYTEELGVLISLEDSEDFKSIKGSINLNVNKLLDNPSKYLAKDKRYYIYCKNGKRSQRAVNILQVYGYDVIKVIM